MPLSLNKPEEQPMSVKSMMVHVDKGDSCKARLDAAFNLAVTQNAHVTGVGLREQMPIDNAYALQMPKEVVEAFKEQLDERLNELGKSFNAAAKSNGWEDKSDWQKLLGDPVTSVSTAGRYVDMIVVGQTKSDSLPEQFKLPDNLVFESGRPVMVIPHHGAKTIGKRILVAWNASREAARAVSDAIPLMEQAEAVRIVTIDEKMTDDIPNFDIAQLLARHNIKAEATNTTPGNDSGNSAGEAILNQAAKFNADLIVMGAYGHSRFRETMLGGATRYILENTKVPAMLSH